MNDVTRILSAIEQGDPKAAERAPAAGLRRAAQAGRPAAGPGEARPDAPGHGPGPRGVPPAGRTPRTPGLGQPRPLLRRRGRGHAPHPRRERPPQGEPRSAAGAGSGSTSTRPSSPTDEPRRRPAGPRRGPRRSWPPTDPRPAELVKLRYFAGLTDRARPPRPSASPPRTADRHWAYARAWLRPSDAGRRAGPTDLAKFSEPRGRNRRRFLALPAARLRIGSGSELHDARGSADERTRDLHATPWRRRSRRSARPTWTRPAAATPALRRRGRGACSRRHERAGSFLESPAVGRRRSTAACPPAPRAPARSSAPTSCWSRSARGAWASSTWPSRRSPSAARWP